MREKNVYRGMLDLDENEIEKLNEEGIKISVTHKIQSGDFILQDNPYKRKNKKNKPFRDQSKRHNFDKFMK